MRQRITSRDYQKLKLLSDTRPFLYLSFAHKHTHFLHCALDIPSTHNTKYSYAPLPPRRNTNTHSSTHIRARTHAHTHTHTHTHVRTLPLTHTHTHQQSSTHTYSQLHTHEHNRLRHPAFRTQESVLSHLITAVKFNKGSFARGGILMSAVKSIISFTLLISRGDPQRKSSESMGRNAFLFYHQSTNCLINSIGMC